MGEEVHSPARTRCPRLEWYPKGLPSLRRRGEFNEGCIFKGGMGGSEKGGCYLAEK